MKAAAALQQRRTTMTTTTTTHTAISALVLLLALLITAPIATEGLTKVIVPAVYKEYLGRFGQARFIWDDSLIAAANYTIVMYQKLNASAPRYVATNRGCEVRSCPRIDAPVNRFAPCSPPVGLRRTASITNTSSNITMTSRTLPCSRTRTRISTTAIGSTW